MLIRWLLSVCFAERTGAWSWAVLRWLRASKAPLAPGGMQLPTRQQQRAGEPKPLWPTGCFANKLFNRWENPPPPTTAKARDLKLCRDRTNLACCTFPGKSINLPDEGVLKWNADKELSWNLWSPGSALALAPLPDYSYFRVVFSLPSASVSTLGHWKWRSCVKWLEIYQ